MYNKDGIKRYVGGTSGNSYASGLSKIENIYSVDIDVEFDKDKCASLLSRLEQDKKSKECDKTEQHKRNDRYSHLKKYIEFRSLNTDNAESGDLWIKFYNEFAEKLNNQYLRKDRSDLIKKFTQIFEQVGMKNPFTESSHVLTDIDPFTLFGSFNKGITAENRTNILYAVAELFGIKSPVPTSFDGIPVLNNMKSWFFAYENERGANDISNLWEFFTIALDYADDPTADEKNAFIEYYDLVSGQKGVKWNITMGLYWIRPYSFINLDDCNRRYLSMGKAFPPVDKEIAGVLKKAPTGAEYLDIIAKCKEAMLGGSSTVHDFVELSKKAWAENKATEDEYYPALDVYDPYITTEEWTNVLNSGNQFVIKYLPILKQYLDVGGEATCYQMSQKYGNTYAYYNMMGVNFGDTVQKITDCQLHIDEDGKESFWTVPFVGKPVIEEGKKHWSWRIRTELMEALKCFDFSKISEDDDMITDHKTDVGKNTILFGPPGTGKTYNTVLYAVSVIENKPLAEIKAEEYTDVINRYNNYKSDGLIVFTTFHQSFGYEEFIEGIKPMMNSDSDEQTEMQYQVVPGIFKLLCDKALTPDNIDHESFGLNTTPTIWKVSLEGTGDNPTRTECMTNNHIRVGWDEYGAVITDETDFSEAGGKKVINAFINRMQIGDIVLSCYSASTIDAIGVITGDYEWHNEYEHYKRVRNVKWLVKGINDNIVNINNGSSLTLSSVYRLQISLQDVLDIVDKHQTKNALYKPNQNRYVFIIDEINRGNISKIFGELITLLEPSKRIGQPEGMTVKLPYSQMQFGVPDNVYLVGTMNTADRSIATIDTALRRRFAFKEMQPDPEVLDGVIVEGIDIKEMLVKINRRIAALYDREHTIGHAYFVPLIKHPSLEMLAGIFENSIIPLLQEYFYEDYEKIRLVLGDSRKAVEDQFIIKAVVEQSLFTDDDFDVEDLATYQINRGAFDRVNAYKLI